jgi:hypothetical protein
MVSRKKISQFRKPLGERILCIVFLLNPPQIKKRYERTSFYLKIKRGDINLLPVDYAIIGSK